MIRLFVLASVALSVAATPLPQRTDRLIYDTAGVIDDAAERELEPRLRQLFERTGVAIVVITVPRLVDETIDQLAVRVGQSWGVGRADQDRGLVVALSRDDRKIFVATGYGTEGYLPDGRVGAMIDEHAMPWLSRGEFSQGLVRLTNALAAASAREYGVTLAGTAGAPAGTEPQAARSWGPGTILLVIAGIVAFVLLAIRHPMLALLLFAGRGFGGGGAFGGGGGFGGFGGGGFGGGGSGRSF